MTKYGNSCISGNVKPRRCYREFRHIIILLDMYTCTKRTFSCAIFSILQTLRAMRRDAIYARVNQVQTRSNTFHFSEAIKCSNVKAYIKINKRGK